MYDFFKKNPLENEKKLSENRVNKVKYSVLSRIEEEVPMKKRFKIKPLIVAAIMAVTAVVLAITVGAADDGQTTPYAVKINGKDVPFTVEVTRGPDYQYTYNHSDKTVTVHDETTIIKFELPEEIVVGGEREVTDIHIETVDENGLNVKLTDTGYSNYVIIYGLPFGIKKEYSKGQCCINVEYDEKKLARLKKDHS